MEAALTARDRWREANVNPWTPEGSAGPSTSPTGSSSSSPTSGSLISLASRLSTSPALVTSPWFVTTITGVDSSILTSSGHPRLVGSVGFSPNQGGIGDPLGLVRNCSESLLADGDWLLPGSTPAKRGKDRRLTMAPTVVFDNLSASRYRPITKGGKLREQANLA